MVEEKRQKRLTLNSEMKTPWVCLQWNCMEGSLALDNVDQFGSHVKLKKECLFLETRSQTFHSCCVVVIVLTRLVVV